MIEALREKAQSKTSKAIMFIVALSFALFGLQNYLISGARSKPAAIVNGHKLSVQTVQRKQQEILNQEIEQTKVKPSHQRVKQAFGQALALTVIDKAKTLAATDLGFYVDNRMVSDAIRENQAFQDAGKFSKKRYQAILNNANMPEKEFFYTIHDNILREQLQQSIQQSSFVLPNELARIHSLIYENRSIGIITITNAMIKKPSISEEEIASYYQSHLDQYRTSDQMKLAYVVLDQNSIAKETKVLTSDIEDYYHNNSRQFSTPGAKSIVRVSLPNTEKNRNQIQDFMTKGGDVKALQNIFPQAKTSSLGWINSKKQLALGVGSLAKTKWHQAADKDSQIQLYYCNQAKPATVKPLSQVKSRIKSALRQDKSRESYSALADRLADMAYSEGGSLSETAKTLGLKLHHSDWIKGGVPVKSGILSDPKIMSAARTEELLKQRQNSGLIQLSPEKSIVFRVESYSAAVNKPIKQVSSLVKSAIYNDRVLALKHDLAKKIQAKIGLLKDSSQVNTILAKNFGIKTAKQMQVSREDMSGQTGQIANAVFATSINAGNLATLIIEENIKGGKTISVAWIKNVTIVSKERQNNSEFAKLLSNQYQTIADQAFSEAILKKAKVTVNHLGQ